MNYGKGKASGRKVETMNYLDCDDGGRKWWSVRNFWQKNPKA
jgi:hypothetical protein